MSERQRSPAVPKSGHRRSMLRVVLLQLATLREKNIGGYRKIVPGRAIVRTNERQTFADGISKSQSDENGVQLTFLIFPLMQKTRR
ncbi:hypothetical protein [Paraburkholderia oxyphila]|uniref:hypothetical protein n=1 Tax=Paraburkholderia oxyphila TaxID=614212 RepID=UPI0012ED3728|nr:hypothetical protein [Paraburkholderia oxyphila]